ncbi:MAG: hypothetical protein ACYC5H_07095 [Methylovirgula sp.]
MLLSVLSALARQDVDPWQEAAHLAHLPEETATDRLAALIMALPAEPLAHRDPAIIAAHLVGLLPRVSPNAPQRKTLRGVGAVLRSPGFRSVTSLVLINVLFMAVLLSAEFVAASHQPPAPIDKDHARVSSTIPQPGKVPTSH